MNEEHSRPFTPAPPTPTPTPFLWLHPHPASSATFIRGHTQTAMHKCTYINTKPVAHTKQVFILSDVSTALCFCTCVCVYVCMCVHTCWYFLSCEGYQPQTYLPLAFHLFLFLSLSLYFFLLSSERQAQPFLQIPALQLLYPHVFYWSTLDNLHVLMHFICMFINIIKYSRLVFSVWFNKKIAFLIKNNYFSLQKLLCYRFFFLVCTYYPLPLWVGFLFCSNHLFPSPPFSLF